MLYQDHLQMLQYSPDNLTLASSHLPIVNKNVTCLDNSHRFSRVWEVFCVRINRVLLYIHNWIILAKFASSIDSHKSLGFEIDLDLLPFHPYRHPSGPVCVFTLTFHTWSFCKSMFVYFLNRVAAKFYLSYFLENVYCGLNWPQFLSENSKLNFIYTPCSDDNLPVRILPWEMVPLCGLS